MIRRVRRSSIRSRTTTLVVAATVSLVVVGPAAAQFRPPPKDLPTNPSILAPTAETPDVFGVADVTAPPEVDVLIARLDSGTFAERESAMQMLIDDPCDSDYFVKRLAGDDLSAEQRHRLTRIYFARRVFGARGAVGVGVDPRFSPQVVIGRIVPDLPAERVMRLGDEVTHIDGRALLNWDAFRATVQDRRPGDQIELTVLRTPRDGEVINGPRLPDGRVRLRITLELGSSELLQNSNPQFDDAIARRRQDEAEIVRRLYTTSRATEIFTLDEESDPVESHPAMMELRRWISRVERGEATLDRTLLAGLESIRQTLFNQAYGPGPDDERQYLLTVCEAYTTLLREFVSRQAR